MKSILLFAVLSSALFTACGHNVVSYSCGTSLGACTLSGATGLPELTAFRRGEQLTYVVRENCFVSFTFSDSGIRELTLRTDSQVNGYSVNLAETQK